jgi:hypothetical protein
LVGKGVTGASVGEGVMGPLVGEGITGALVGDFAGFSASLYMPMTSLSWTF